MNEPKSLIQIISEEEFLPIMQNSCEQFLNIYFLFKDRLHQNRDISRKFYSNLVQEAEHLESFMDEYGARENKKWTFFVECLASVRNLSIAAFFTRHIIDRYPYYNLKESLEVKTKFDADASNLLNFLNESILNLLQEIYSVGILNGLNILYTSYEETEFLDIEVNKKLPCNVTEDEVVNEEDRIVEVCEKIKHVSKLMNDVKIINIQDPKSLKLAVLQKFNEKQARMFKNLVHNIQSDFDTYIKNTKLEHEYSQLKIMRGYISMPLHLLEISLWLSHFYERHEDEIRHGENKKRISLMVNKEILLDKIVNFGFVYSHFFINQGKIIAEEIIGKFLKIKRVKVPIPKPLGFHARPSTYVSMIARHYVDKELHMIIDEEKFNTKSVMSLLQAGGIIADKGYQDVFFEGDPVIIEDIKLLAKSNYCEDCEIPSRLSYLREYKKTK